MKRWARRSVGFGASVCAFATLATCGGHTLKPRPGDASTDASRDAGAEVADDSAIDDVAIGTPGADAGTDVPIHSVPNDGGLIASCGSNVPLSYVSACSGCHTLRGQANPRYPDLFAFKGSEEDFLKAVRVGGAEMSGLPASIISDADLLAIYRVFTKGMRQGWEAVDLGAISPLFTVLDAKYPPIVSKRDDGAIITRGAGRVRTRHEKEGSFGLYSPDSFFLDSAFGFTIEDFTVAGQQRIRVTFLPPYKPNTEGVRQTNFRHWKAEGNNNTFMFNDYLVNVDTQPPVTPTAPFGGVQQFDEQKVPGGRTMAVGENYEIEFGIYLPAGAAPRRDSFYTDTFRYRIGIGGLTPNNRDYAELAGPLLGAQLGGDTTIAWLVAEPHMYYEQMALNTQHETVAGFLAGRRLFYTDFATGAHLEEGNRPFDEQRGKAGPLNNASSCEACHLRNGGGSWVNGALGEKASIEIKLLGAGPLGDQLQPQEGTATVTGMDTKNVVLSDGLSVQLRRPKVTVVADGVTRFSVRVARPLVGLGLLEAIDERALVALSDRLDCDHDGISGRLSIVTDPTRGATRVGRFGWKAEKVSVAHQVADDLSAGLGVTTHILPDAQGKEELSDSDVYALTTYMRLIGVPPQRKAGDPQVRSGAQLFQTVGCAACHRTDLLTAATHSFAELRNQAIRPFTDLLLHDMGPDLADDSAVPAATTVGDPASASEWRTPPLWGIGLAKTVNPDAAFLHDGRAASLLEAILWHGGEAERSKKAFVELSAAQREALLVFLQSL